MILQTLLFPDERICPIRELYYRTEGTSLDFGTYFNSFSINKWKKYTNIRNLYFVFIAKGNFTIEFWDNNTSLNIKDFHFPNKKKIRLKVPYNKDSSIIAFTFSYNTDIAYIYSGYYETDMDIHKPIKLAIGICTYRREKLLLKNIELLKNTILDNICSPLYDKVQLFISDNGRTLNPAEVEQNNIHIFPNCNAGGSGGFTRTLIEVLKHHDAESFTHIILMDDDVIIEPDSFIRTYALLSLIKEEYEDSIISGTMLRSDLMYVLHENGAVWDGSNPILSNPGLDLRKKESVYINEQITPADYAAWWYACYSLNVIKNNGLPLPIFFHGDDVEYGLRINADVITLNGICVWHDPFENKRASMLSYYDIRNILLINACYQPLRGIKGAVKLTFRRIIPLILRYRYKDAKLLCLGIEDFCRGIDWLKKQKPEPLNTKVIRLGYEMKPIGELTTDHDVLRQIASYKRPDTPESIYSMNKKSYGKKYIYTLNGWIFPAKSHKTYAYPIGVWPFEIYRKYKVLLFDPDSQKGILVQKSYIQAMVCLIYYIKTIIYLKIKYHKVCEEYRQRFNEMTTLDFWENYLELKSPYTPN